jgi:hypothetical protein
MRTRLGAFLLAGGVAVAMTGVSAASSLAATAPTFTVSPGGVFAGREAGKVTILDTVTNKSVVCTTTSSAGSFESGSGLSGTGIGSFTGLTLTGCTGPKKLAVTATAAALPWSINAVKYIAAKNTTYGTLNGLEVTLSGTGCSATVAGATSATGGTVVIHFHNSPRNKLPLETAGGNLHVYVSSGCKGLFKNGDALTLGAAYVVSPDQTITSP